MRYSILSFLICLVATARSQSPDTTRASYLREDTLQEIVVSATRYPEKVFAVPFSIDRLRDPLQGMPLARTVPEAMAYIPGVFVQKTNHGGGSPFLRGLTGNQTLLMLDGIRVNNATFRFGPNQYPNLIDGFSLQRVEVLKGSGSVQYGSDALGGVMHAVTRDIRLDGPAGWQARAGGRITSQDMEYTARAEAGYVGNGFGIRGGYTWRRFGDLYGGDTTGKQTPSGYDERNWDLKAKIALGKKMTLTASAQEVSQSDVPLYHRVQLENFEYYRFDPQRMFIGYARLEVLKENQVLRGWRLTPLVKKSVEGRQYHRNGNVNYYDEKDAVTSYGIVAETDWQIMSAWTSSTGAEIYRDQVSSRRTITNAGNSSTGRGLYPDGASQINASVYSLHHIAWKQWKVEAGLRYNLVENRIPGKFLELPGGASGDARLKADAFVWNASLLYQFPCDHVFYGNVSTGFRAPGIDDMGTLGLVDFRYEVPAYDLQPERNIHYEIGYRFRGKRLQLQAAAFYMELEDLISRVRKGTDSIQGYPVYIKVNDQQAFIKGIESSASLEPLPGLDLHAMIATQYGQNLTRDEPLRRIPPTHGLGGIRYARKRWYAGIDMLWASKQERLAQGDRDDNRIPDGGTPGWQVFNLMGGYLGHGMELRVLVANIFNEDYRTHGSGINAMGRALTISAMFNFADMKR